MKIIRKITVEFDRNPHSTAHDRSHSTWCEACGTMAEFVSQHEAVHVARILAAQGMNLDRQAMHFHQNDAREVLVCINSLVAHTGATSLVQ